jgi:CheY-like chemotaxis protein
VVCDETGALHPELARYPNEAEFVGTRDLAQVVQELHECPAHAVILNMAHADDPWSLIETIKHDAPGIPIVGCSVPRPLQRALEAGALGHLTKPVTRANLEAAIQAVGQPVRRILVVDDDPQVLKLFSRMLRVCDDTLEVVTASNGKQGLDELRRSPPDLLLLDIFMFDMDGWQVLEKMRRDEGIPDVPTFLVSAQDPADQPQSEFLLATMDGGLSLGQLFRCSLELSALLLKPDRPDPALV